MKRVGEVGLRVRLSEFRAWGVEVPSTQGAEVSKRRRGFIQFGHSSKVFKHKFARLEHSKFG